MDRRDGNLLTERIEQPDLTRGQRIAADRLAKTQRELMLEAVESRLDCFAERAGLPPTCSGIDLRVEKEAVRASRTFFT